MLRSVCLLAFVTAASAFLAPRAPAPRAWGARLRAEGGELEGALEDLLGAGAAESAGEDNAPAVSAEFAASVKADSAAIQRQIAGGGSADVDGLKAEGAQRIAEREKLQKQCVFSFFQTFSALRRRRARARASGAQSREPVPPPFLSRARRYAKATLAGGTGAAEMRDEENEADDYKRPSRRSWSGGLYGDKA